MIPVIGTGVILLVGLIVSTVEAPPDDRLSDPTETGTV
jgi:hypothetical protein